MVDDDGVNSGKVKDIAEAVGAVCEKVPVYQDAFQPFAKQVGKAGDTIGQTLNVCLGPLEGMLWGYGKIAKFLQKKVGEKLKDVPPENIQTPAPHIAVPAIEALRYTGHEESLADMYVNLLASSMNTEKAESAHPAFVDMIKNMCPDEAKIMKLFASQRRFAIVDVHLVVQDGYLIANRCLTLVGVHAGCEKNHMTASYVDNLNRLGLLSVDKESRLADEKLYAAIVGHPNVKYILESYDKQNSKYNVVKYQVAVTDLGGHFLKACSVE